AHVLDLLDAAGWQVRQRKHDLTVLIAAAGPDFHPTASADAVRAALTTAGRGLQQTFTSCPGCSIPRQPTLEV
ncbi:MAG: hypothetical protein ACM30G_17235, partial [Micromonosporaceae bacterium]